MSTSMQFRSGTDFLYFEAGGDYPAGRRREVIQAQDRTASGEMQVETLGIYIKTRRIVFTEMSVTDWLALENWHRNVVNASAVVFEFTDEYGDVGNVRFVDSVIYFTEVFLNLYSGTLTLEYVGVV
jgi:hypothetical protein